MTDQVTSGAKRPDAQEKDRLQTADIHVTTALSKESIVLFKQGVRVAQVPQNRILFPVVRKF
jgi:hypothetical protein